MINDKTNICVIIPAYNEELLIGRTIRSVLNAGLAAMHIYVVDDGSQDLTYWKAVETRAHVHIRSNAGKSQAVKSGIEHFKLCQRYNWIAILDADSQLDPLYFTEMRFTIEDHPDAILLSAYQQATKGPYNCFTAYRAVEYTIFGGITRESQYLTSTINVVPGPGSLYKSSILATLDFNGGTLVEDMDWTTELHRRGLGKHIHYVPNAIVTTQDPTKLRDFIGQLTRWYRGTWQVIKKHRIGRHWQRVDAEWLLLLGEQMGLGTVFILGLPLWLYLWPRVELYWIALDQILLLCFTLLTAIRQRRADVLVMFPTFWFIRILGYLLFMRAFLLERRHSETTWFSVERREA